MKDLKRPDEVLLGTRSVVLMVLHAWYRAFYLQIDSPRWKGYGFHSPDENIEGYYYSYQISMNKAWTIVLFLREKGFQAMITTAIPMKTTVVKCGLGCTGKNTLFVNPELGPRLGLWPYSPTPSLRPMNPSIGTCAETVLDTWMPVPDGR